MTLMDEFHICNICIESSIDASRDSKTVKVLVGVEMDCLFRIFYGKPYLNNQK